MGGFKIPHRTALLQFEGDEMDGCEVRVSLELSIKAQEHMGELKDGGDTDKVLTFFADNCLVEWNLLGDGGEKLPINAETFMNMPGWMSLLILNGWGDAVKQATEISAPLADASKNGSGSPEESETMEASLSSQPN